MVIPDWLPSPAPENKSENLPQTVPVSHEALARPLDRLAAAIVDIFVLLTPIFVLISAPFKRWMTANFILGFELDFISLVGAMVLLAMALIVLYQALSTYFFKATLGKMLFDLRVQPVFAGDRLTFLGCIARSLIWIFECLLLGLPLLAVFANSKRRALHDRICDTVVVSKSSAYVLAPGKWERGMVRGFFSACALFILTFVSFQLHEYVEKSRGEKKMLPFLDHAKGECDNVSRVRDGEGEAGGAHGRLQTAMSLYAAGLADRSCLESEVEREVSTQTPVGPITYLAQAFVNSDDAEVSNSYLDQVCEDAPDAVECAMSKVVSRWAEEDWKSVDRILSSAPKGSGYLEVWAVRHFMKQARYPQAMTYLNAMADHRELAEFTLEQRVKALYNSYMDSEANVALLQALPSLPKEESQDLSGWVCAQQLQNGCDALDKPSCVVMTTENDENAEIDFERTGPALASVMTMECKSGREMDYLTLNDATQDEDWRNFLKAAMKLQKDDAQAAYHLYSSVVASNSAPELLRVEALRRLTQFATKPQLEMVMELWSGFESKESWIKAGNLLFASFAAKKDHTLAMQVAQGLMDEAALSPQAQTQLTEIALTPSSGKRQPASIKRGEDEP